MTFQSIIGHQPQIRLLQNAIANQRVAHAYLFSGSEGVGKRQVALGLARALLCETGTGCDHCQACHKVEQASHPDVFFLASDGGTLKIEQIRALQQQLALRPFEGRYRVCLIDGAEQLTSEAANALLKTLEEPRPQTLLILISCQSEKVLPTIRSRCQLLTFSRIPKTHLCAQLEKTLGLPPAQAKVLAAVADGSFKKAFGQYQELYLKKRPILIQTLSALSATSTIQTFEFADRLRAEKETLSETLDMFQMFYRDLLLHKKGLPPAQIINQDLLPLISQQSQITPMASLIKKIEAVTTARKHLARNVNPQLAIEYMLLQITHA